MVRTSGGYAVTLFRRPQGLQTSLTCALALTALGLAAQAQGASGEGAPAATGQPRAEGSAKAIDPAPASNSAAGEPAPTANPSSTPPRRFIPTEQVSEDRAVAFPKDI